MPAIANACTHICIRFHLSVREYLRNYGLLDLRSRIKDSRQIEEISLRWNTDNQWSIVRLVCVDIVYRVRCRLPSVAPHYRSNFAYSAIIWGPCVCQVPPLIHAQSFMCMALPSDAMCLVLHHLLEVFESGPCIVNAMLWLWCSDNEWMTSLSVLTRIDHFHQYVLCRQRFVRLKHDITILGTCKYCNRQQCYYWASYHLPTSMPQLNKILHESYHDPFCVAVLERT